MYEIQLKCPWPDCPYPAYKRRQRTQYQNDEENFAVLCEEHHKENDDYWNERWNEYYRSVL